MAANGSKPRLLPREALIPTGDADRADWNHPPRLGALQRKRFELLLSLMGDSHFERLLEVGYGSGVLMPELWDRCDELVGVDVRGRQREVKDIRAAHGVCDRLVCGSATALPFESGSFDGAVTVSALEYVEDVHAACSELERVLTSGGALIVVTPGHSRLLDLALRITTAEAAADDCGGRRQRLVPALLQHFRLSDERVFPRLGGGLVPLYRALKFVMP